MEDRITLSLTEAIACEAALDEVLEGLRATAGRRKEGLTWREVALEKMLAAARRSIGAKLQAAEDGYGRATVDHSDSTTSFRDLKEAWSRQGNAPWPKGTHRTAINQDESAVYDVHLEPGAAFGPRLKPGEEPLVGEGGDE